MRRLSVGRWLVAAAVLALGVVVPGTSASAAVLYSWGEQGADGSGFGPPVDDGCWTLGPSSSDEYGTYPSYWAFQGLMAQASCESTYPPNSGGWLGARFNGPVAGTTTTAPATTTTTAPATTTTTAPATTTTTAPPPAGPPFVDPVAYGFQREVFMGSVFAAEGSLGNPPSGDIGYSFVDEAGTSRTRRVAGSASGPYSTARMCYTQPSQGPQLHYVPSLGDGWSPTFGFPIYAYRIAPGVAEPGGNSVDEISASCTAAIEASKLAVVVPSPSMVCVREFLLVGGRPGVRVTANVLNPSPGAVDQVTVRLPWRPGADPRTVVEAQLPATLMPADGWVATCEVVRTLRPGVDGSDVWKSSPVVQDLPADVIADPVPPKTLFAPPPALPPGLLPWVATPGAAAGGAGAAGPGAVIATIGLGASLGWLGGGVLTGVASRLGAPGGSEWFCRWNPAFLAVNETFCSALLARDSGRSLTQFAGGDGVLLAPSSPFAWRSARAIAQVLVDPSRPLVGGRTAVGHDRPVVTDAVRDALCSDVRCDPSGPTGADPLPPVPPPAPTFPDSADCDFSLVSLLSPSSLVRVLGCSLRSLFVPSGDHFGRIRADWDSGAGKLLGRPFSVMAASWSALGSGTVSDCAGPSVTVPGGPGWAGFVVRPIDACSGPMATAAGLVRPVLTVVVWLGAVVACARVLAGSFGISLGRSGGDS